MTSVLQNAYTYYSPSGCFPAETVELFYGYLGPLASREFSKGMAGRTGATSGAALRTTMATECSMALKSRINSGGGGGGMSSARGAEFCGDYHAGRVFRENYSALHLYNDVLQPLRKELVFDIDMTDLSESRRECGCGPDKKALCSICWKRLAMMVHVIRSTLTRISPAFSCARDGMPVEGAADELPVLCVFSGGRGAHLYVCHQPFCDLTPELRTWLITQLSDPASLCYDKEVQRKLENDLAEAVSGDVDEQLEATCVFKEGRIVIDEGVTRRGQLTRGLFSPHPTGYVATPVDESVMRDAYDPVQCAVRLGNGDTATGITGHSAAILAQARTHTENFIRNLPPIIRYDSLYTF